MHQRTGRPTARSPILPHLPSNRRTLEKRLYMHFPALSSNVPGPLKAGTAPPLPAPYVRIGRASAADSQACRHNVRGRYGCGPSGGGVPHGGVGLGCVCRQRGLLRHGSTKPCARLRGGHARYLYFSDVGMPPPWRARRDTCSVTHARRRLRSAMLWASAEPRPARDHARLCRASARICIWGRRRIAAAAAAGGAGAGLMV